MVRKYLMIGGASFILGAGAMAYIGQTATAKTDGPSRQSYRNLQLFGDVLDMTREQYVTPVDDKKLVEAAMEGMLASLDPHSGYLDPQELADMRDTTRGAYGGLGLEVTAEEGAVKVVTPMDDTPAGRAGLQSGDFIIAIDGQSLIGLPLSEAVKKMKGAPGSALTLTIARQKADPFDVKLVREVIKPKAAIARMEGDYGYLKLGSGFNEKTTEEAEAAIRDLKAKNPGMKGLVLDLRNNPGGLLDQAVSVTDLFLDGGEVVSQRGRRPDDITRYNARPGDILNGLPMVVLINSGSASAAEIVAGALQDRRRAEVVGLTSFGKGSVQTLIPLNGGQDGALKLTTARYFTPSGRSIQKTGIEPDLEVAATREQAELLAVRTFQPSEASYAYALDADEGKIRRGAHKPAEAPPESFDEKADKADFQLKRALDVLRFGGVARTPKLPGVEQVAAVSNIPGLTGQRGPTSKATPPKEVAPPPSATRPPEKAPAR
jgi:carboxyl-terminal processing protease